MSKYKDHQNLGKILLHVIRNPHHHYSIHRFANLMNGIGIFDGNDADMIAWFEHNGLIEKISLNDYMAIPDEYEYLHTVQKHNFLMTHKVTLTQKGFVRFTNMLDKEYFRDKRSK